MTPDPAIVRALEVAATALEASLIALGDAARAVRDLVRACDQPGRAWVELSSCPVCQHEFQSATCRVCFRDFELVNEDGPRICIDCLEQKGQR